MKNFVQPADTVDVVESVLVHPVGGGSGFPASGDQVAVGTLTGVAEVTGLATTDIIPVRRRGVCNLPVNAINAGGNSAVAVGDKIYLDLAANAALNKKVANQPFGIALAAVTSGATATIPVLLTGF